MRRKTLLAGILLVLLSNGAALVGVAWNRNSGPVSELELSERELPILWQDRENSGVVLHFRWAPYRSSESGSPDLTAPFDEAKLRELGFRCPSPHSSPQDVRRPLPREVFVALEFQGPAWERWVKQRSKKPESETRLFAVDASTSRETLRERYAGNKNVLIVRGVVRAFPLQDSWRGTVSEILPSQVCVPLPFSRILSRLNPDPGGAPRYTVGLAYGRRLEPWVTGIK